MVPAPLEPLSLDQPLVALRFSGQNAFLHGFSPKDRTQHNLLLFLNLLPLFFFLILIGNSSTFFFFERNVLYVNANLMNKQVSICHKAFTVLIQNTNQFLHFWV